MVSATRPRDVAMADVDRCFDQLPAGLDELVIAVRGRLGRPGEYFLAEDDRFPPVLDVHAWVIDDIGAGGDDALEQELFVSGYFRLAALAAHQMVLDGSNGLRSELGLAVPVFGHLADARLARVLPPDSPAWASVHTAVVDAARAGVERYLTQSDLLAVSGRRWAPMISLTLAGVHHARRSDLLRPLIDLLYRIYDVADVRGELHNLRADAQGGAPSYPVWRVSLEAGLPRGAPPDRVIGALLTTACAARIIDETRRRTAAARIAADQLGLRRIVDYLDDVESSFGELAGTVAAGAALAEIAGAGRMCTPAPRTESPRLREASARALDFLLDDENMREAWDVHRTGFLGMDVRVGRPFPVGFALENLGATGVDVTDAAVRILEVYRVNAGDYFDGPVRLPRDIDTLGLMLRVRSRLAGALPVDELLERPIPGLMARAARGDELPVWLDESAPSGAQDTLLGMHCATSQASLLLGLARRPATDADGLLRAGAERLACTLTRSGAAATVFYSPRSLLWIVGELGRCLTHAAAARQLGPAGLRLLCSVEPLAARERAIPARSPQDAALMLLAHAERAGSEPQRRAWIDTLLRGQRPDGSWEAEPLYWAPTPQSPSYWYASRTATSSLCHRALATSSRDEPRAG